MTPKLPHLAVLAAFVLSHAAARANETAPVVLRLAPPEAESPREAGPPPVYLTIPKYTLSNTEREIVAACLVLEAANQGEFGMRSVMAVIRNRARGLPELFAPTVLRPKQFSALNSLTAGRETLWRMLTRAKRDMTWNAALGIVDDAWGESWHDPTHGATHYTRVGERTRWAQQLARTVTIGEHAFYR